MYAAELLQWRWDHHEQIKENQKQIDRLEALLDQLMAKPEVRLLLSGFFMEGVSVLTEAISHPLHYRCLTWDTVPPSCNAALPPPHLAENAASTPCLAEDATSATLPRCVYLSRPLLGWGCGHSLALRHLLLPQFPGPVKFRHFRSLQMGPCHDYPGHFPTRLTVGWLATLFTLVKIFSENLLLIFYISTCCIWLVTLFNFLCFILSLSCTCCHPHVFVVPQPCSRIWYSFLLHSTK